LGSSPTLDPYASHDLVEGLVRLPTEPAPLSEAEVARLDELDASYDEHAAILEDEDSAEEAVAAAEAAIEAIERECQEIRARPPVIAPELKAEAGMVLVLARDGTPVLQPVFYGERQADPDANDGGIEVVPADDGSHKRRTTLSKRLVDELAMQRRDVLALHVASDPGLALDIMVFTLADADTHDWRARPSTTLRAPVPAGPIIGFEAKDAPACSALAELRSGLDESWRAGDDAMSRFDLFRALPDDSRAAWLGYVVARSLEASLNMGGERQLPFQDHLGSQIGIDMAQWWRPTAANYFDRVSKQVILDALTDVGGLELSSRFAAVKKGDLAMSAERVFAGTYITEVEVREKALAWVPEVMRFACPAPDAGEAEIDPARAEQGGDDEHQSPRELAA
jgi:ParB family transcriptional regulator, chromosome partitioning protein